jgi:agmatine deiminase
VNYLKCVAFSALIICISCKDRSTSNHQFATVDYYTQDKSNRMAAEWEPASGAMITWPLCVPYKLAVEISKENILYTLVDNNRSKAEAIKWYLEWGIDTSKVIFISAAQGIDAWWVRDWGPPAVFTPGEEMKLADGRYIYSTPVSGFASNDRLAFIYKTNEDKIIRTETDDKATKEIGKSLHLDVLNLPFINTGGNVMTDGLGTAFSTSILTNENRFDGVNDKTFFSLNKELLGLNRYHILPNFESNGIQHIDCFMKLLDEERLLVARPPVDHALYPVYEQIIAKELKKLKTVYNREYQILRIDTYRYSDERLSAYTNSLILNKTVYVPLFGIPGDSIALRQWAEAMPGYKIKGFEYEFNKEPVVTDKMLEHYKRIGWNCDDALHCRTRAVWDKHMLYINVKRIDADSDTTKSKKVYTTIIDYSRKGLQTNGAALYWKTKDEINWNKIALNTTDDPTHFYAAIPPQAKGSIVEYYISAVSNSGRTETMPRTAPEGYYSFTTF